MPIVYSIVCNITGEKYYGSSIKTLEARLSQHKCKYNTCISKQIILRGDYDIYPLGKYDTIEEAELKEKWYIDNKNCINQKRVRLTEEERKEYHKEYYEQNKEQLCEKNKEYREQNKQQIREYKKEYRQENKEQLSEYKKKYQQENKEQIREKESKKVECEFCKSITRRGNLRRHQRSKKCKEFQ
tara:strand:+ start:174 stop:728 length:555 start_codon:yes stop_codon:yes gene_type:complete